MDATISSECSSKTVVKDSTAWFVLAGLFQFLVLIAVIFLAVTANKAVAAFLVVAVFAATAATLVGISEAKRESESNKITLRIEKAQLRQELSNALNKGSGK